LNLGDLGRQLQSILDAVQILNGQLASGPCQSCVPPEQVLHHKQLCGTTPTNNKARSMQPGSDKRKRRGRRTEGQWRAQPTRHASHARTCCAPWPERQIRHSIHVPRERPMKGGCC